MKKIAILFFAIFALQPALAEPYVLRLHQFLPLEANVPKHILGKWIDDVERNSNGRIAIQHFPSMQLGGTPPELYDQAVDGVADIIWTVAGYTPGRFPQSEVFELPFIMSNAEATSKALWQLGVENFIATEMADTHVLGLWVHGPGLIHSKKPIASLDDLRGLKLRAPNRITTMLFKNLGAESIGMPVPAVPENLAKGVIDAAILPWEVTGALKIPELVSHHTSFGADNLYTIVFIFAMNKQKYNSLPADLQKIIDNASGLQFSAFAGKTQQAYDLPAKENAKLLGNNIIELPPHEIAKWQQASQNTIQQWIAEINKRNIDGKKLFEKAQKYIAQNE